jgi:hypothetical protein
MQSESTNTGGRFTTDPISAPPPYAPGPMAPEFIRLPKPGTLCNHTGLSRSKMWEILQTGKVKTVSLRRPGAVKGARLVHLVSLLKYLHSKAEGGGK